MRIPRETPFEEIDEQLYWVKKHYFESGGSIEHLINLIDRVDIKLTPKTRRFIAGVLSGQIKAKGKERKKYFHHLRIYSLISDLISKGIPLTCDDRYTAKADLNKAGAARQIAEIWGISEDAAIKIYQRMKPKPESIEDYL
ncbi:hypothetical protein [Candidatus Methylomicrobium oryzae]|uniref:hypothetical protein n=1 Tax=Candidatus Methylomicrobium oryzae TaxID=2802053 RepID=UPI0019206661|nr:hypothetical protein [Methylomicrobium sp. RS1]MBL1263881.1 hypothetical protein [Methylomicrobium sp. RS1]